MLKDCVFTSESVNDGHPDKVCDQISDAVLDALLAQDPDSRGACESLIKTGYACRETEEYMPFAVYTAHRIGQRLRAARRSGLLRFLRPDGKCQVSVEYRDGRPRRAHTVVVSPQHTPEVTHGALKEAVLEEVVKKVVPPEFLDKNTVYFINPTGRFEVGGPQGDC